MEKKSGNLVFEKNIIIRDNIGNFISKIYGGTIPKEICVRLIPISF